MEEMQAAAQEAHRLGRRVNANACGAAGIRDAILAGVDCIEHGSYIGVDEDVIPMMVDRQVGWVPTLCVYDLQKQSAEEAAASGGKTELPDYWINRVLAEYAQLVDGFEKALHAGVPIAVGTDSGAPHVEHGGNAIEMEMFVKYGMSEMDAIAAATSIPARILGMSDRLGMIQAGKQADMVVVKKDPLKDIRVLQEQENIALVIKHGEVVVDRMQFTPGV
jgi:imidazolonepropionase-like amidohydrolase